MRAAATVSLLVIGISTLGQSLPEDNVVNVYLLEDVSDRGMNLLWAKSIASKIFAEAGVRIKWRIGEPRRGEQQIPILIKLTSDTPASLAPGSLAYAQVYEGVHIRVFCDRIQNTVRGANPLPLGTSTLSTFLLAHVMAHEIAHILEGINRHSNTGLMKPSWTKREIEEMSISSLSLAPEDVQLVRAGLLKRVAEREEVVPTKAEHRTITIAAGAGPPNR
jgi:hypothetical protein